MRFDPNREYTYGEILDPAMKIETEEEADAYLADSVRYHMIRFGQSWEEALRVQLINLGYWAGYYDAETRERVERLFRCSHPIFGKIAEVGQPTPDEAFRAGVVQATLDKDDG